MEHSAGRSWHIRNDLPPVRRLRFTLDQTLNQTQKMSNRSGSPILRTQQSQICCFSLVFWKSFYKTQSGKQKESVSFDWALDGTPREEEKEDREQEVGTHWVSSAAHGAFVRLATTRSTFKEMPWKGRPLFYLPAQGYLKGTLKHGFFTYRKLHGRHWLHGS